MLVKKFTPNLIFPAQTGQDDGCRSSPRQVAPVTHSFPPQRRAHPSAFVFAAASSSPPKPCPKRQRRRCLRRAGRGRRRAMRRPPSTLLPPPTNAYTIAMTDAMPTTAMIARGATPVVRIPRRARGMPNRSRSRRPRRRHARRRGSKRPVPPWRGWRRMRTMPPPSRRPYSNARRRPRAGR
jgi:hypothetical protein